MKTIAELDELIKENYKEFRETCELDMSEPTTAEINLVRELRKLVEKRKELINLDPHYHSEDDGMIGATTKEEQNG